MKAKTLVKAVLPSVMIVAGAPLYAAEEAIEGATVVHGEITPKLVDFEYFKGSNTGQTQFLERYDYQKGSNTRSGVYLDADVNVIASDAKRDVFVLDWQGFGAYNHRGTVKADSDKLGFSGYYSNFRSATGGIDFLYNPNRVAGGTDPAYNVPPNFFSGQVAQFNNDSNRTLFTIDRTTYGAGVWLKPEVLGQKGSATVNYDGDHRDGNKFSSYMLGFGELGGSPVTQGWRGFDKPVNEKMNRYSLNLTGTPGSGLQLAYDGSLEKFDHNAASDFTVARFVPLSPQGANPLLYTPDSTLMSNNVRLARNFGRTAVAAGYGLSVLEQDSFTSNQEIAGYGTGKITTNSAYLNANTTLASGVGLEGFIKYNNRENGSTFPATGLIDPNVGLQLDVRINKIESWTYGLAATFRPAKFKSTVTVGWKREDKDRDLTWSAASTVTPFLHGVQPQRSLYREQTVSDEFYVNWVARPMPGLNVRVTPSYLIANRTSLITEPSEAFKLKTRASYVAANGMSLSGYYNYQHKKNDNNSLTEVLASLADGTSTAQKTSNALQTAGVSLGFSPRENLTTSAGLSWLQNDFGTYFLSSNLPRYQAPNAQLVFFNRDATYYKVDSYVFSLGADLQATEKLHYSGYYSYTYSKGQNATGQIGAALPTVDERVDNDVQTVSLGVDYAIRKNMKIRGMYSYAYYSDRAYGALTGGVNALMVGLSIGF